MSFVWSAPGNRAWTSIAVRGLLGSPEAGAARLVRLRHESFVGLTFALSASIDSVRE